MSYRPNASFVGEQSFPTANAIVESCHRYAVDGYSALDSGTLHLCSVSLQAGEIVGHIGFCTGTPASNSTNSWIALLDSSFKQVAHSADQLATNFASSTWHNLAMVTPYTAQYTGCYYFGIMVAVSTGPKCNVLCANTTPAAEMVTGIGVPTPVVGGMSSTGLTGPGTDGVTTYIAPTAVCPIHYMYATP
jgi:hypothetical protein